LPEGIKIASGQFLILKVEFATKDLHAQQGKDDHEEEEEQ
jgi:hypothetical protein